MAGAGVGEPLDHEVFGVDCAVQVEDAVGQPGSDRDAPELGGAVLVQHHARAAVAGDRQGAEAGGSRESLGAHAEGALIEALGALSGAQPAPKPGDLDLVHVQDGLLCGLQGHVHHVFQGELVELCGAVAP